jgi:2-haloacid dehalogenase
MGFDLITFDAYAALVDYRSSLLPVVETIPGIDKKHAPDFLELWRARQLGAAVLSKLIQAWYPLTPWPEAEQILTALRAKKYRLAILSNGDQDMLEALVARFETPFDHILSSEQCGVYKPHPRVYGLPFHELGIEKYLHVAGSPNDAIGATAAGVSCYWSNRQGDTVVLPDFRPDYQGPDLSGILDVL